MFVISGHLLFDFIFIFEVFRTFSFSGVMDEDANG